MILRRAKAIVKPILQESPLSPALFKMFAWVFQLTASSGVGSDYCLDQGFLPVPVHFYSPIPDLRDLEARRVWDARSSLGGIDFREGAQEALLAELGRAFGGECRWPLDATEDPAAFFVNNQSFSYGCAASTHGVIRRFRPAIVVEVGSGHSSRVIAGALHRNRAECGQAGRHVVIDPYPDSALGGPAFPETEVITKRVELLDPSFFEVLNRGDILFIDSGHSVRIGGDVNYLFLEVLPKLAPGVVVHVHDISMPYEYPKAYATSKTFRQFWTEQYLLQAFLCFNKEYQILLAMNWLMVDRTSLFRAAFPNYDPALHAFISSSFWMQRVSAQ